MAAPDLLSRPSELEQARHGSQGEEAEDEATKRRKRPPQSQFSLTQSPGHEGSPPSLAKPVKPVKLVVFTMLRGKKLDRTFPNGRLTTAGEILEATLKEFEMPEDYSRIFGLWLCSKHLQLQLKAYHMPCKLFKRWKELLSQYTNVPYEEICKDEPILSFRRNAFYHLKEERKLRDPRKDNSKALELLYHEAVNNVIQGRYPMAKEELHTLAGLKAAIEVGPYDKRPPNIGKKLSTFYPKNMTGLIGKIVKSTETQFLRFYQLACGKTTDPYQLKLLYLQLCWSKPFYGAVMFRGQIERPFNPTHYLVYQDKLVTVAINTECLHLFTVSNNPTIMLYLTYDQLSWGFEPANDEGEDFFCSLWLEFDSILEVSGETQKVNKRVQIFSRQAPMMDAMIAKCVQDIEEEEEKLKEMRKEQGGEEVLPLDVIKSNPEGPSQTKRRTEKNYRESRLVCTTYNEEGELIEGKPSGFTLTRPLKSKPSPHAAAAGTASASLTVPAGASTAGADAGHTLEETPPPGATGGESQPLVALQSRPKTAESGPESNTSL